MPSPLRQQKNLARKERTRSALLDAGSQVFIDKGFHRTLISDIVAAAGVGQGTFYRFFDSKRAIFMTLLDGFFAELLAEFSPMTANLPTNVGEYREASIGAIRRVAIKVDASRELARMFLRETPSIDDEADARLIQLYDRLAELAQFYLDHAIANGFARPCNSAIVAQALVGIGARVMQNWFESRLGDHAIEDLSRELVDFAFLGFGIAANQAPMSAQKES